MAERTQFSDRLQFWRRHRGFSQLALAHRAGVSQRHLSFLESGRTSPSRDMVLRLAAALDLPLRQQNALLQAAGFAAMWSERPLGAPEMQEIGHALDFMLARQEPYPAFVVDRRWNLLRANEGALRLVEFLTGGAAKAETEQPVNLADALLSPEGLRGMIANWPEVAAYFLRGVQADALADASAETAALLRRLLAYPDVADLQQMPASQAAPAPVLAMHFVKDGVSLNLFTTISTLGTPQDVTAQEIRIENFYPADEATATHLAAWKRP